MQRLRRYGVLIATAIAFAVLLSTAVFSVSFARWSGGETSASANGTVGKFYVEYPTQYDLDTDTYYLKATGGYYEFVANPSNGAEVMLIAKLEAGASFGLVKGYSSVTLTSLKAYSTGNIRVDGGQLKTSAAGIYSFYYVPDAADIYVGYENDNRSEISFSLEFSQADAAQTVSGTVDYIDPALGVPLSMYVYSGDRQISADFPGTVPADGVIRIDMSGCDIADANTYFIFAFGTDNNRKTADLKFTEYFDGGYGDYSLRLNYNTSGYYECEKYTRNTAEIIAPTENDIVVRSVAASTKPSDVENEYVYRNYVCVSRDNKVGTDDNSIAFVNFTVDGDDGVLSSTHIKSFNVKRMRTDPDGSPSGGSDDFLVYNSPNTKTLADINYDIIEQDGSLANALPEYMSGGTYLILFFGDYDQQYFALDIEIVTDAAADFTLTATASNINGRNRFKDGFGMPKGFYLGGLMNNVLLWDPRFTTNMTNAIESEYEDMTIYDDRVHMNQVVSYPKNVDLSININLTEGSKIKMYMLDETGDRDGKGNKTIYFIPKKVLSNPSSLYPDHTARFDDDFNLDIHATGDYKLRLVGTTEYGAGKEYVKADGTVLIVPAFNFLIDTLYITGPDAQNGYAVMFEANGGTLAGDAVQNVAFAENAVKPDDPTKDGSSFGGWYTDEACTVPYDFSAPVTADITLYAKWTKQYYINYVTGDGASSRIEYAETNFPLTLAGTAPEIPVPDGKHFVGWAKSESAAEGMSVVNLTDFDGGSELTLYPVFAEEVLYTVTFDINGGIGENIEYNDVRMGETIEQPSVMPEKDLYEFNGWYTSATGGEKVTFPITVGNSATYYAHYVASKLRVKVDVSELVGINGENDYHIHAWKTVGGEDTTLTSDGWNTRPTAEVNDDGLIVYELDDAPSGIIITMDKIGTRTEIGRYAIVSSADFVLGTEVSYVMTVDKLSFDPDLINRIGLAFNDGFIVLNASYDTNWTVSSRPNKIFMKDYVDGADVNITSGWPGDAIQYGRFVRYNCNMSQVYEINLNKDGDSWTGGITPNRNWKPALANGSIYDIKYDTFIKN